MAREGGGAAAGGWGAFVFLTHLSRQLVWGAGPRVSTVASCFPHIAAPPPRLDVAGCHPLPQAVGLEEGVLDSVKVKAFSLRDPGLLASSSSLLRNLILWVWGTQDFFFLMSSLGPARNSWAHLRAGPGLTEASPLLSLSPPIISPLGLHLDNTISLPPLWLGLPAPKPLARGEVSWGQFGLNPAVHILQSCPLTSR